MNKSIKNSKVHHYADDTNLLLTEKSLKKINKQVNQDLALICRWLRANKINLNTSKTEIIIFRPNQKQITKHLNFRISEQKINTCSKVRYLGVVLEELLYWNLHINSLKCKLHRAIGILTKIRHYVPNFLLNYYTILHSHLIYSCQIRGQNNTVLRKLKPLQNKALRIINFKNNEYNVNELYKTNEILIIADYIKLLNCLFVRDVIAQSTIPPLQETFIQMRDTHQHNTRHATQNTVTLNQYKTAFYSTHSIKHQSALIWNQVNNEAPSDPLQKSRSEIREYITDKLINSY